MRNKVLIVDADQEDREAFETILTEMLQEGGELYYAGTREGGLKIVRDEKPQLVFLDTDLLGDEEAWMVEGVHVVVVREAEDTTQRSEDFLTKPLTERKVLEKCQGVLDMRHLSSPPLPPI